MITAGFSVPLIGGGSVLELGDDVGIDIVAIDADETIGGGAPASKCDADRGGVPTGAAKTRMEERSKEYDIAFIKAGANYGNISRALDIVRDFIVAKSRIIYGGMSIDISLRAAGAAGIYPPDEVPDYDFMSPEFYADSIELAGILHAAGFAEVNSINGTHVSTRRVRLGSDSVADITYTPPAIYAAMPTVAHDGFRVVHPDFQRMDMHRALSLLLEKPPREVIQQRAAKDYKRYGLLDAAYPIVGAAAGGPAAERTFRVPAGGDYVVGGFAAMAELLEAGAVKLVGDELKVRAPSAWGAFPLCLYTDRPYEAAAGLKLQDLRYHSRYLDSYHPRAIVGRVGETDYEIYDNLGTLIPTWRAGDELSPRLCTVHLVALYMLLRSFAPPILGPCKPAEAAARAARFRGYYGHLAGILRDFNLEVAGAGGPGFAISLTMYGSRNWPLEYLQTMAVNSEHVARAPDYSGIDVGTGENEPLNRPTVKLGWYPERGMPPEIIAAHSELFLMTDGAERPAFRAILPLDK